MMDDTRDRFEDRLKRLASTGVKQFPAILLGSLCIVLSVALLRKPGFTAGILGSFIGTSGIQILLWAYGIRLELLGNTSTSAQLTAETRMGHILPRSPQMIFQSEIDRLNRAIELAELQVRLDELMLKKAELEMKLEGNLAQVPDAPRPEDDD